MVERKGKLVEYALPNGAVFPLVADAEDLDKKEYWRVQKIEPGQPRSWVVLSKDGVSSYTHYIFGDGTRPCWLDIAGECAYCDDEKTPSRRWAFYLCVWDDKAKEKGIVSMPRATWKACRELDSFHDLSGYRLNMWREGTSRRSRMKARLDTDMRATVKRVVPGRILLAQLLQLWNVRIIPPEQSKFKTQDVNYETGGQDEEIPLPD